VDAFTVIAKRRRFPLTTGSSSAPADRPAGVSDSAHAAAASAPLSGISICLSKIAGTPSRVLWSPRHEKSATSDLLPRFAGLQIVQTPQIERGRQRVRGRPHDLQRFVPPDVAVPFQILEGCKERPRPALLMITAPASHFRGQRKASSWRPVQVSPAIAVCLSSTVPVAGQIVLKSVRSISPPR